MVRRALAAALAAAAFSATALAAGVKSGPGNPCPKDTPCASQYGDCGVGAFCLGGCDPLFSHQLNSCVPNPTCKAGQYKLKTLDDVKSIDTYLGDASTINWQSQGKPVVYNDALLLTMAEGTVGTLLASTHYVWYGKICAKMTTSQGKGVVTAFIMMSDVRDEIDFEFVGVDINHAQTNYYSQGVTVYTHGENLTVSNGNTVEKVHEYCIDWKPDTLTWAIDGNTMRTLKRSDTWNGTANRFDYPQTPSRVMLSLWPAGLPSNEKGTIDWAGGQIDWNSAYMQNGYYYAMVQEVTVQCYDPPSGANIQGDKSYIYTDKAGTNNTVKITDDLIVLSSFYATGENPKEGASSVSSGAKPTKSIDTVPGGLTGGGNRGGEESSVPAGASATAAVSGGGAQPSASAAAGGQGFNQGGGGGNQGAGSSLEPGLGKMSGSAFAVVLAVLGLIAL
ncbi:glycosyl hydrolases family 16-domain-containing protein [Clohesyomyces aquaticus]|uniref:Glycosyl hydrolases family 16-domain-containing protein n=1 Tax=Clohesyomyces aquaticus TaxID=1231657 RepID=A0A1Y1YFY6_9PLEO|nr:glycosyl hydrolases family 16-domain-containing protein [Clohesyomyces aquaticus]